MYFFSNKQKQPDLRKTVEQIVLISLYSKAMDMHQRLQHRELGAHLHPSRTFKMPTELHLEELVMIIVQF